MASQEAVAEIPSADKRFLNNTVVIIEIIKDVITNLEASGVKSPINGFLLDIAKGYVSSTDSEKAINMFISRTAQHWESIRGKDPNFLKEYMAQSMFDDLDKFKDQIAGVPKLLNIVTDEKQMETLSKKAEIKELIDEIWDVMGSCVKISINYVHEGRKPVEVVSKGEGDVEVAKMKYTQRFYPDLSVKKLKEFWNMD